MIIKRNQLVKEFWDRSNLLNLKNKQYYNFVNNFLKNKLKEDNVNNDITTNSLIKNKIYSRAKIIAKEKGVLAGIEEVTLLFKNLNLKIKNKKNDGNNIKKNETIIELKGDIKIILSIERTVLNVLQRMSGIATLTHNMNHQLKNKMKISATRKTLWGLLDKKAVSIGGGLTHRLNLSDSILIKDNHLKIFKNNIGRALELVNKNKKVDFIEIEITNEKEALDSIKKINNLNKKNKIKYNNLKLKNKNSKKIFAIMFDNMKPLEIKNSIKKIKNKYMINDVLFEASGNINENNIKQYSQRGVDVISLGSITHSAKALNMSMEIQ